ncbi:diguanylate cyclase domain-containing protein [Pseudazoarcus pumilus]|nr:diguanylate cyclase [Pseudazoarcus pumilus]
MSSHDASPDGNQTPRRPGSRHVPRLVWITASLVGAILLATMGFVIRGQEQAEARLMAEDTARTYALLTQNILEDVDRVIGDAARDWFAGGDAGQRLHIERTLQRRKHTSPYILELVLIDADARIVAWTGDGAPPPVHDRPYYTFHRDTPGSALHVSPPLRSRAHDGEWFFSLSRAVRDSDGHLLGIGVAALLPVAMQGQFDRHLTDPRQSLSLVHRDGLLVFRIPREPLAIGTDMNRYAPPGGVPFGETFDVPQGLRGERRAVHVREVLDGSLLVAGTSNLDIGLATWRLGMFSAVGLWALFVALGYLVVRELNRRHLREQEAFALYHELFEAAPDTLFVIAVEAGGQRFRYVAGNPALESGIGIPLDRFVGSTPHDLMPADKADALCERYRRCMLERRPERFEESFDMPAGCAYWMIVLAPIVHPVSGRVDRIIGIARDITHERSLTERLQSITSNLPGFVYQLRRDAQGRFEYVYASEGVEDFVGIPLDAVLADADTLLRRIHPDDFDPIIAARLDDAQRLAPWHATFRMTHADGRTQWVEAHDTAQRLPDGSILWTGYANDVTERKRLEEQVRHLAHHDTLTGLPNRSRFMEIAERERRLAERRGSRLALLFIDLDRFKPVNDTHGHAIGDRLLQQAAHRITECVRATDVAARLGGDEFVVLLQDVSGPEDAMHVAEKIRRAVSNEFVVEGLTLELSCSIGVALYPDDARTVTELMRRADQAMYLAKAAGRN